MHRTLFAAFAALALLSACAAGPEISAAAPAGRDCFRNEDINGFSVVDDHTLKVTIGARRDYLLTTRMSISELRFEEVIGVRSRPSNWICTGDLSGVEIFGGQPIQRNWLVDTVARAPEAPAEAAPASGS